MCTQNCSNENTCPFENLESSTKDELKKYSVKTVFKKHQIIFSQGHTPHGIFCIKQGKVKIVITDHEGKEFLIRIAAPGELIGLRALLSNESFQASAVALEDSTLHFLPKEFILNTIQKSPAISLYFLQQLSRYIASANAMNVALAYKNVRERLADFFISLLPTHGVFESNRTRLNIILTREEMAAAIGTTHETLVRLITEFKNENIITQEGKTLFIINQTKLSEFAHN